MDVSGEGRRDNDLGALGDGTVKEEKSGGDNMVSFKHYAFGSVGEFYYPYILGIRPLEDGYRNVLIQPYPDSRLKSVSGKYLSGAGEIDSSWSCLDGKTIFDITVPTETRIILPDGRSEEVGTGSYHYEIVSE